MRTALFLSVGLALSLNASAANERCTVSFAAARQDVCHGTISPLNVPIDALTRLDAAKDSTLRLIKFDRPIDDARRAAVQALGVQILGYAPFDAYIVRMSPSLDARARAIPGVLWSGPFLPAFKIDPNLAAELELGTLARELGSDEIEISLVDASGRGALQTTLGTTPGLSFVRHVVSGPDTRVIARFDRAQLRAGIERLALDDDVIAITLRLPARLENSQADWLHQSNINSPSPLMPVFAHGIYGCGQIVAALDSGLHAQHCAFNDPAQSTPLDNCIGGTNCPTITSPNTAARKVVAYYKWSGLSGNQPEDELGHGTHVAGSMLGQNPANPVDCTNFTTPGGNTNLDGTAPGAKLVMQEMGSGMTYLNSAGGTPYHAIKTAYDTGARIHNDSWGVGCIGIDGTCAAGCTASYGSYTRDADRVTKENPDLLVVFAAGNQATSCPDGNNVVQPANAKNVLTIGANQRGVYANDMSSFSSRGPTTDWRTKPELVAQGENIVSAATNTCGTTVKSGTSMASPTAAGLAALVREYLQRGFYPTGQAVAANAIPAPSGALVKAILIAGAARLTGTGSGASPGQSQGFGRIALDNSLYFDGDARRLYLHDSAQGLASGGEDRHTVYVSSGVPLDVTLTWADEPAAINADPAIVNALRLEVISPTGEIWTQKLPVDASTSNANPTQDTTASNYDARNTVQRIRLPNPAAGAYQIRVRGISVPSGPQRYALAATGSFQTSSGPDFALQAVPADVEVCAGRPASVTVGVQSLGGFTSPVALSVTGLPGSSTGVFAPPSVVPNDPSATSMLTITGTSGLASGAYDFVVDGSSTTPPLAHSVGGVLLVTAALPPATTLTAPPDGASTLSHPTFEWTAVSTASNYRFQLSTSPTFATLVTDTVVTTNRYIPSQPLDRTTTFYWRVIPSNTCGDASSPSVYSFTTQNAICSMQPLTIPDGEPTGATRSLSVATTGTVNALRLRVDATHSNVGNLIFTLSKDGTSVRFLNRPGDTNPPVPACNGSDMHVIVDDAASDTLEHDCRNTPNPAYIDGASYKPNSLLSAFVGTPLSGTWSLKALDIRAGDSGTLDSWCLLLDPSQPDSLFANGFQG